MDIYLDDTDFLFAMLPARLNFPGHTLTVVVKGTFDLKPDAAATLAEEQLYPDGDLPYDDAEGDEAPYRYEYDYAPFKPRADLMVVGSCHPPKRPTNRSTVTVGLGKIKKSLEVAGDRTAGLEPEPFLSMPVRYDLAERTKRNPGGKDGKPNVEAAGGSSEPAGFGPLNRIWPGRATLLGTSYGRSYLKERWPWYAKDMDLGYFNAAPRDMQVEGYLNGDEALSFVNMHPDHPVYRSRLPGLRAQVFVNELGPGEEPAEDLREVKMVLDTLWVDTDAEKLVLVWRGATPVKTDEFEEIAHIYVHQHLIDDEPITLAAATARLEELREEPEKEPFPPIVEPEEADASEAKAAIEAARAEVKAEFEKAGLVFPDAPNVEEMAHDEEKVNAALAALAEAGVELPPEETELTREDVIRMAAAGESLADQDLSALDLSDLDLGGADLKNAILNQTNFMGTNLAEANLTEAIMPEADLTDCFMRGVVLSGADATSSIFTRADLTGAKLDHAQLGGAVLDEAILDEVVAEHAVFEGGSLMRVSAIKGNFTYAIFAGARVNEADFEGATLVSASLEGAEGIGIRAVNANLTDLRASSGANLAMGTFKRCLANESVWADANLFQATFAGAHMQKADFTGANLDQADLVGADCREAVFRKTRLRKARMTVMNLFHGIFEKADLSEADLTGSNCYGAEFLEAATERATFTKTNLKMTKLDEHRW